MSKLLIQDGIIDGMDVYVEYTFDTDGSIVLYDYGIELTSHTPLQDGVRKATTIHSSLRGYMETAWMPEKLEEYITAEHTVEPDYE